MYQFLCIFFIYAFLGWCAEVAFAALRTGKFVNRGFLNGPVCPIYGFGVVIVLAFLEPLKGYWLALFFGAMLLTSLLELITGYVLEKIFHQHWWDYSNEPFNLRGYICLRFSVMWGLACTFVVYILHPTVELFIYLIPHTLGVVALWVCAGAMSVDLAATVSTIAKFNRRLSRIDELAAQIKSASNELGEGLAERVIDASEKSAVLREDLAERVQGATEKGAALREDLVQHRAAAAERLHEREAALRVRIEQWSAELQELTEREAFGQRRLMQAFPDMRSIRHGQALDQLRERLERRRGA